MMDGLQECFQQIPEGGVVRAVLSKPAGKNQPLKKITAEQKGGVYQFSKYTEKQVFHENVPVSAFLETCGRLMENQFLQCNAWDGQYEYMIRVSRKGRCAFQRRALRETRPLPQDAHNREKNYLLEAGAGALPLVDMGVFTKEGRIVNAMYGKYRQINRYLEIIDDAVKDLRTSSVNVIDFGCGKSYLTFIVYYYLTKIKGMEAHIVGLDLKEDVIEKCNASAARYGYENLRFELGDINGYQAPFPVDIVMTLHACDTATDYALFNAVRWKAKIIFSVPCCQHELNRQIQPQTLPILSRYGIIQERFSALATDAIRGNLLEYCGYKTQLLEFIDFSNTPKNLLIRAVYKGYAPKLHRDRMLEEAEQLMKQFHFSPTLYRLLFPGAPDGLLTARGEG